MKNHFLSYYIAVFLGFCFSNGITDAQNKEKNNFEDWGNKPPIIEPGECNSPPSDAIVLFDETLDNWMTISGENVTWHASKKGFRVIPGTGDIITKQKFGSCQLHVEWKIPDDENHKETLDWGNSGLYFMGLYEVQIYDSYMDKHKIYYNGQAGSIYKQHSPLVNSSRKPGEWQTFDIVFNAPVFNTEGELKSPASFTVFHNGVLIQNNVTLIGPTEHADYTEYKAHEDKLPLLIQCHGAGVYYRNIWIREL